MSFGPIEPPSHPSIEPNPLTISWTGGASPGTVLIGGYSHGSQTDIGFACTEDAAKGSFTIPSFILAANSTKANGTIFIGQHPLTRQVAIPGTDVAWFVDGSSDSTTVVYH